MRDVWQCGLLLFITALTDGHDLKSYERYSVSHSLLLHTHEPCGQDDVAEDNHTRILQLLLRVTKHVRISVKG